SELAARNHVDPSTLTRLGQRLGFSGFGQLQDVFRRHVRDTQPFYSARVRELVSDSAGQEGGSRLQRLAQAECRKVLAVADALDDAKVEEAARRLLAARRVPGFRLRAGAPPPSPFPGSYPDAPRDKL